MIFNDASTGRRGIVQAFHENVKLNFDIIFCRIPQVLHRRTPTECDRFVAKVPRCPHGGFTSGVGVIRPGGCEKKIYFPIFVQVTLIRLQRTPPLEL
jgi:hypothetical protein